MGGLQFEDFDALDQHEVKLVRERAASWFIAAYFTP
jgi:hypothetical protein